MSALLAAQDVTWPIAGASVVEHVSFKIQPGEFISLMGRNGAGKSTVVDLLAGLRRPHGGAVLLHGRPVEAWPAVERARRVGHMPQSVRAHSAMCVEQIVTMGRYPHHPGRWMESAADCMSVEHAMDECGCLQFRHRRLSTLSGGERQRVLLAACIAQEPEVLLLDEPSTFLDVDQQLQSFAMLRARADRGAACVAVSHDLNLALTFCSRIILLADRTVARDMTIEAAVESDDWLALFSPRLRKVTLQGGRSWVAYQ